MNQSFARPVTPAEFEQGYVCADAENMRYSGELCKECSCWMVAVEKLRPNNE